MEERQQASGMKKWDDQPWNILSEITGLKLKETGWWFELRHIKAHSLVNIYFLFIAPLCVNIIIKIGHYDGCVL